MDHQKQPYDASLKGLIRAQVAEMLQYLIEGATFVGELNTEVFKPQPPLRTDEAFKIFYRGQIHIYHLELEMRGSRKMPHRMLSYHALLHEEHEHPVISMIMYPFRTTLPESPFREMSGTRNCSGCTSASCPSGSCMRSATSMSTPWSCILCCLLCKGPTQR